MNKRRNRELWFAFAAILVITLLYGFTTAMLGGIPPAREFFGHTLGIIGFLLMLMTETLYSLRKRSRNARWGRMSQWLDFHIFTGIVGPYLVLLHSSWKLNGLAGIVMLMTVIIVVSGFVGRYIYTAVPRTADGVEVEASFLEKQIEEADACTDDSWQVPHDHGVGRAGGRSLPVEARGALRHSIHDQDGEEVRGAGLQGLWSGGALVGCLRRNGDTAGEQGRLELEAHHPNA